MKYESDIAKMEVALEQAKLAYKNDEIPVGAALFNENDELVVSDHTPLFIDESELIRKVQSIGENVLNRTGLHFQSKWPIIKDSS